MISSRAPRLFLLSTALVTASACRDATEPRAEPIPSLDAQAIAHDIEPMLPVFERDAFVSLHHTLAYVGGLVGFTPLRTNAVLDGIADDAKGKTFVFGTEGFVPDPAASGAPADGFRAVMHGWNDLASAPDLPLTRLGYLDVTPVGAATTASRSVRLRLVRDAGNATLADYTVSATTNAGATTTRLDGTATDGTTDLHLDVTLETISTTELHVTSAIASASRGVGVTLVITPPDPSELRITHDGRLVTLRFGPSLGEVRVDGRLYATFSTVANGESLFSGYTRADGVPLSEQETRGLDALINTSALAALAWSRLTWF